MAITIRGYRPDDAQALANIYYNTIHRINIQHYTKEQVDVWAPETSLDKDRWAKKFERTQPFVAIAEGQVVGFAEFEADGHIDCFYCHHDWIGCGVGSALMNAIHDQAYQQGIKRLFSEVSITAKPFFERCGFTTICEQTVVKSSVELTNFKMEKRL
jgi:putative acetyltransferase